MGGFGSTRWGDHVKARCVEDAACTLRTDVLPRTAAFRHGHTGEVVARHGHRVTVRNHQGSYGPELQLGWAAQRGGNREGQVIAIDWTNPHFGGVRWWFTCPDCSRRCGRLYLPNRHELFACRECHGLTYRSRQQHDRRVTALLRQPDELHARVQAALRLMQLGQFPADLDLLMAAGMETALRRSTMLERAIRSGSTRSAIAIVTAMSA